MSDKLWKQQIFLQASLHWLGASKCRLVSGMPCQLRVIYSLLSFLVVFAWDLKPKALNWELPDYWVRKQYPNDVKPQICCTWICILKTKNIACGWYVWVASMKWCSTSHELKILISKEGGEKYLTHLSAFTVDMISRQPKKLNTD